MIKESMLQKNGKSQVLFRIGQIVMYIYILFSYIAQDFFISSKFLSVSLYAFLAISLIFLIVEGKINKKVFVFFVWGVCFACLSMITLIYSPEVGVITPSMRLLLVAIVVSFCFHLFIKTKKDFYLLCWVYAVSSLACVISLIITGSFSGDVSSRLGSDEFGNANIFSNVMMMAVFFVWWLLVYGENKWYLKLLLVVIVIFDIYALAFAGGRTAFVTSFVFFFTLIFFKKDSNGKRRTFLNILLIVLILFVVYLLIMNVPVFYESIGIRFKEMIDSILGNGGDNSTNIRNEMRRLAFEKFWERPFFGFGFDSFKYYAQYAVGHFFYSHCNFSELLYNGGLLYFVAYYWIYYKIIKSCYKTRRTTPTAYLAFSISAVISLCIRDYGAVSYTATPVYIISMLALAVLYLPNEGENIDG